MSRSEYDVAREHRGRRVRRLGFSPEFLAYIGSGTVRITANELPDDMQIVDAWVEFAYSHDRLEIRPHIIWVLIESAEYEPLSGTELPTLEPVRYERVETTEP